MKLKQALTMAIAAALVLSAGVVASAPGSAQDYPSKNITLVVPFPPGGGNDAMARIMADRLTAGLGRTVIVENRGWRRHRRYALSRRRRTATR
jgi:tripartite-type tricarboxylate transporter receptor subunit TctC